MIPQNDFAWVSNYDPVILGDIFRRMAFKFIWKLISNDVKMILE